MAAGLTSESLLSFRLKMHNNGSEQETLKKITVVLQPQPGQPGNPPPRIFSFSRNIPISSNGIRETFIASDEKIPIPLFQLSHAQISLSFYGHSEPITLNFQLASHRSPTPQGSLRFFGNTRDMDFDEYFYQSRHTDLGQFFEYDMKVCRWNEDVGKFTKTKPGTSGDSNEDYFGFGKPLYAMADGTVISFTNDVENNPAPSERALIRLRDEEAGPVGAISLARLSEKRMATSVRTAEGKLKIIIWDTVLDSNQMTELQLVRLGDIEGDAIIRAASVALSDRRLVTVVRTSPGPLKVIVWNISSDGQTLTRMGEDEAGVAGQMAVAKLKGDRIAVAVQTAEGDLKVIIWDISQNGLSVKRVGDELAGAIEKVDIVAVSNNRLFTAVQTSGNNLKVIVWDVADDGTITRRGDEGAESISDLGATQVNSEGQRVVTAVKTAANRLKLIVWDIDSSGNPERRDDLEEDGEISALSVSGSINERNELATCVITKAGTLKVNTWKSASESGDAFVGLTRFSSSQAGTTNLMDVLYLAGGGNSQNIVVTAVRTVSGNLKLIVWWVAAGGGNHVYLLHGDELVYFAHMMKGSLDPAVCKLGASVKQGQFVGRMGNSGASGGPHCHIEASQAPMGMTAEEMIQAYRQGTLSVIYRPMPFHNAQAMKLTDVKPGILADNKFSIVDGEGFYYEPMAIWPGLTTPGIPTGRSEMAFHGIKSSDYQKLFNRITGAGYRLVWIDGYAVGSDLRFNVLFRPDGGDWSAHHNLNGKEYQEVFMNQKKEGRRLVHVNSYRSNNRTLYAAIFRRTGGTFPIAYHNLPQEEHQERFNSLKADGFVPINVSVVSENGQLRYTAFYEKRNVGGFLLKSSLTPEQYQIEFDEHKDKDDGFSITYLDAYEHDGNVRFATIWNQEHKGITRARHHLTGDGYQKEHEKALKDGFLTAIVAGYALNNKPRFLGVWRK